MRKTTIPQFEFAFSGDTFNLSLQSGRDTERDAREQDKAQADREAAESRQTLIDDREDRPAVRAPLTLEQCKALIQAKRDLVTGEAKQ